MNKHKNFLRKIVLLLLGPLIVLMIDGCKSIKEMSPTTVIPDYTPERVLENLKKNQSEFDWFEARFTGDVWFAGENHNISGTIRIKKDETIYFSLAPVLGIEVARVIVTPDTVKFLNRLESSYYVGHIGFINSTLRTSLDYDMLQGLLMGNDFSEYESDSFVTSEENGLIKLHDPERRQVRSPGSGQTFVLDHSMWVDSESFKIKKNTITEITEERSVKAEYNDFKNIEGETIPTKVDFLISDGNYNADFSLQYVRISLNEPREIKFSVPSRYDPIDFE